LTSPARQKGQPGDDTHAFPDHVVVSWFDRPREIAWLGFPVYPRISQYCVFSECSLFSDYARKRAGFANEYALRIPEKPDLVIHVAIDAQA
jgi:hypothetical protein